MSSAISSKDLAFCFPQHKAETLKSPCTGCAGAPSAILYLLELFDAAVIAHLLQVGFESLDAGSTIGEAPDRGEAFGGEMQRV